MNHSFQTGAKDKEDELTGGTTELDPMEAKRLEFEQLFEYKRRKLEEDEESDRIKPRTRAAGQSSKKR